MDNSIASDNLRNQSRSKSRKGETTIEVPPHVKVPPKFVKKLKFENPNQVLSSEDMVGKRQFYKPCKYKPKMSSRSRHGSDAGSNQGLE